MKFRTLSPDRKFFAVIILLTLGIILYEYVLPTIGDTKLPFYIKSEFKGLVLDPDSNPIQNAYVAYYYEDIGHHRQEITAGSIIQTDKNGIFKIPSANMDNVSLKHKPLLRIAIIYHPPHMFFRPPYSRTEIEQNTFTLQDMTNTPKDWAGVISALIVNFRLEHFVGVPTDMSGKILDHIENESNQLKTKIDPESEVQWSGLGQAEFVENRFTQLAGLKRIPFVNARKFEQLHVGEIDNMWIDNKEAILYIRHNDDTYYYDYEERDTDRKIAALNKLASDIRISRYADIKSTEIGSSKMIPHMLLFQQGHTERTDEMRKANIQLNREHPILESEIQTKELINTITINHRIGSFAFQINDQAYFYYIKDHRHKPSISDNIIECSEIFLAIRNHKRVKILSKKHGMYHRTVECGDYTKWAIKFLILRKLWDKIFTGYTSIF